MLNDWIWQKIRNYGFELHDNDGRLVASLTQDHNNWLCTFYNDDCHMSSCVTLEDIESSDEAIWQATLWIYKECNRIANSFLYIRDHLTSLHELRSLADSAQLEISNN